MGLGGDIFAPVALIIGLFFYVWGQEIFAVFKPSGISSWHDVHPSGAVLLTEYLLAPGILLWAYGERLSGGSVAYGAV